MKLAIVKINKRFNYNGSVISCRLHQLGYAIARKVVYEKATQAIARDLDKDEFL